MVAGSTLPPEVTEWGLVGLYDLETREIYDATNSVQSVDNWISVRDRLAEWEKPWVLCYYNHASWLNRAPHNARNNIRGKYLGYDLSYNESPVNQHAYLGEWRADVARFCHSFDALPGFESFRQLTAAQKTTAFRVGQTIGGHAWERLGFWLTYDAALSGDWKLPIVFDPVEKARNAVCIECQSESGARRLSLSIDHAAFGTKLSQGRIHQTDRSVNPWTPGDLLTVVPAPGEEVTIETAISTHVAAFNGARDYYDKHVAHVVVPHDHD